MQEFTLEECVKVLQEANDASVEEIEKAAFANQGNTTNGIDYISVNVPLFMRLLEYAKEDAKTDMDLHKVTENILSIQQGRNESNQAGSFLTMDDYDVIVNIPENDPQTDSEEEKKEEPGEKEDKNTPDSDEEKPEDSEELTEGFKDALRNTIAGAAVAGSLMAGQPALANNQDQMEYPGDIEFSQQVDAQNQKMQDDMGTYMYVMQNKDEAYKNIDQYPKLEELDGKEWPVVINQDGTLLVRHPAEEVYNVLKK